MMNIIQRAFDLMQAVEALRRRVRAFYYEVMLWGQACPRCEAPLRMIGESRCQCTMCRHEFDPTVSFQQCMGCGGQVRLRIRRYVCRQCGRDIRSRFVYDRPAFDREYFRERMAESRKRAREHQDLTKPMVVPPRSEEACVAPAALDEIPGLLEALDGLVSAPDIAAWLPLLRTGFDLKRYQGHVLNHIGPIEVPFDTLPQLENNTRLDRIWRFVAIVFLAHSGEIELWQENGAIMVMQRGTHGKGQGVSGETEAADGIA